MVKAIITARRLLSEKGITTTCEPDMINLTIGEVGRPAIRITVAVAGAASVSHTKETPQ